MKKIDIIRFIHELILYDYRSAEGNLHSKVAELQEDISIKRFDLGVAQLQLAAVHAQVT